MREIQEPSVLKKMSVKELNALAQELREEIIRVVSEQGGHLASNLGIVELTLALYYVFDAPDDKILFDVGHQTYAQKLLTGRLKEFQKLRARDGASGFPQMEESDYESFAAGHASTAISAALGMARTRDIMHGDNEVVAVVGDGALTGGMCYEALNDAGQNGTRMIVVLNDNEMSISPNVGAMHRYLTQLRQSRSYRAFKRTLRRGLERIPGIGSPIFHFIERFRDGLRGLLLDGKFFSALGFEYIGPIDGHDLKQLIRTLKRSKDMERPALIHVVTQKGKGYQPAESHPDVFHGVAPFYSERGEARQPRSGASCGQIAARLLSDMADTDIRIAAITAAMPDGTGMSVFQKAHLDRFFDVGIAEEHAVTMAAGMAAAGMKPYVAIYSTFMERAYDQMLIDVCRNSLPVTFLLDRAGFVGADGATHQGLFDLSYLRSMPNMIVAAPRDVRDLKKLIALSAAVSEPMAIRYSKECDDLGPGIQSQQDFGVGEWELLSSGSDVMIFAVGRMVQAAMQASIELMGKGLSVGVVDARFVKPMDEKLLLEQARKVKLAVTLEENVVTGGFGEGVLRLLEENHVPADALVLAAPDRFVSHATIAQQTEECGLDSYGVTRSILARWAERKAGA